MSRITLRIASFQVDNKNVHTMEFKFIAVWCWFESPMIQAISITIPHYLIKGSKADNRSYKGLPFRANNRPCSTELSSTTSHIRY